MGTPLSDTGGEQLSINQVMIDHGSHRAKHRVENVQIAMRPYFRIFNSGYLGQVGSPLLSASLGRMDGVGEDKVTHHTAMGTGSVCNLSAK